MAIEKIRLTAAQAVVKYLCAQKNEDGDTFIAGCWAIFGHGNVAGMGEALHAAGDALPTWRGHNEQSMAHSAIAYAKALNRRRAMAVTTSIGPGATNLVTAAATAHVNRLPVLLIPGDVFANRAPDPVLQQVEDFSDGTVSANDCLRPVSRFFDRISRPEQLLTALPRCMLALTDPALCGPATLAICQDTQAEAFDFPVSFFEERVWRQRRPQPDPVELAEAADAIKAAEHPVIICGGGVLYAGASAALQDFAETHNIPLTETQAGKGAVSWEHPLNLGAVGVTGGSAANAAIDGADLILAVGSRLQDFTTGSWTLVGKPGVKIVGLNVQCIDASKRYALPLIADARDGLNALSTALGNYAAFGEVADIKATWMAKIDEVTANPGDGGTLPTDAQVVGAVQRASDAENSIVLCAAGSLPAELHKLWKTPVQNGYHMEYGFSCMGYEVAGGIGAKMAHPAREVIVMIGDGSYLMANSEIATSVMLGQKMILIILDNRGFGCINRLQISTGAESFNNLLDTARHEVPSSVDFRAHAESLGATAEKVGSIDELEAAMARARASTKTYAVVIDTDPMVSTPGTSWWDVAIPEVSKRPAVNDARARYEGALKELR